MIDTPTNAEVLFGSDESIASNYAPSLLDSMNQLRDSTGMSEADSQTLLTATAHFFHGAGIKSEFAAKVHSQIVENLRRPPDPATLNEWATTARQRVRERYPEDGDQRMALAKDFIDSHPAVRKQLDASGISSDPGLVLALADYAYNLRPKRK